jgi:hypothetical protein
MLIVSDFHDYYDPIASLGMEKECPYHRKESTIELGRGLDTPAICTKHFNYQIHYRIIGFCGKIYPLVLVEKIWSDTLKETTFFYEEEKLSRYLEQENVHIRRYISIWRRNYSAEYTNGLKNHFNPKNWDHFLPYFQQYKTPVFMVGPKELTLNNSLKKFKFQQVKDPYTAFQEIYMYLSGVLGVEVKPTVKISDKDMAESKGHGGEYSFRKPPGKRGKKRWR